MKNKYKKAATLIEAILYSILLSVFMLAAITFAIEIIGLATISGNMDELQSNQEVILQKISDTIYTAASIDTENSVFESDNGTLSLIMSDEDVSPTKFFTEENNIFMQEGSSTPIQLNTNDIKIDYFNLDRVSFSKSPDQIIIDMQLSSLSGELSYDRQELLFHISLTLRNL